MGLTASRKITDGVLCSTEGCSVKIRGRKIRRGKRRKSRDEWRGGDAHRLVYWYSFSLPLWINEIYEGREWGKERIPWTVKRKPLPELKRDRLLPLPVYLTLSLSLSPCSSPSPFLFFCPPQFAILFRALENKREAREIFWSLHLRWCVIAFYWFSLPFLLSSSDKFEIFILL